MESAGASKMFYLLTKLHGVTFQKSVSIFTTLRILNFISFIFLNWFFVVKLMAVHSGCFDNEH
jgi:hypothetical protein